MEDLKLKLDAKSKAVDDAVAEKKKIEDELQMLKDQVAQAAKDEEEVVKAAREEVEKNAAEVVEGMKNCNSEEFVQSHEDEEGWNALLMLVVAK